MDTMTDRSLIEWIKHNELEILSFDNMPPVSVYVDGVFVKRCYSIDIINGNITAYSDQIVRLPNGEFELLRYDFAASDSIIIRRSESETAFDASDDIVRVWPEMAALSIVEADKATSVQSFYGTGNDLSMRTLPVKETVYGY